jgi:hypothetical protein
MRSGAPVEPDVAELHKPARIETVRIGMRAIEREVVVGMSDHRPQRSMHAPNRSQPV